MNEQEKCGVVRNFLDRLVAHDVDGFLSLWRADAVMEMPFAPPGAPKRLSGEDQLRTFWSTVFASMQSMRFEDVDVAALSGSDRVVAFHKGKVMLADGSPYDNQYACLFELDNAGRIGRYVEHYDPMVVVRAFGDERQLSNLFAAGEAV